MRERKLFDDLFAAIVQQLDNNCFFVKQGTLVDVCCVEADAKRPPVESLAQRVIDGAVVPWEIVPAIKMHELVKFHTAIPGSPTLYTASFFLAMNKAKYEAMPADLRAILDKHSGLAFATRAGNMWDEAGLVVLDMVKKRGNTIDAISEEEKQKWIKACEPVTAAWIEQVKAKGLDGAKLIAEAKALIAKHNKT